MSISYREGWKILSAFVNLSWDNEREEKFCFFLWIYLPSQWDKGLYEELVINLSRSPRLFILLLPPLLMKKKSFSNFFKMLRFLSQVMHCLFIFKSRFFVCLLFIVITIMIKGGISLPLVTHFLFNLTIILIKALCVNGIFYTWFCYCWWDERKMVLMSVADLMSCHVFFEKNCFCNLIIFLLFSLWLFGCFFKFIKKIITKI